MPFFNKPLRLVVSHVYKHLFIYHQNFSLQHFRHFIVTLHVFLRHYMYERLQASL